LPERTKDPKATESGQQQGNAEWLWNRFDAKGKDNVSFVSGEPLDFFGPNLASELIAAGLTFGGYSEDLPFVGGVSAVSVAVPGLSWPCPWRVRLAGDVHPRRH